MNIIDQLYDKKTGIYYNIGKFEATTNLGISYSDFSEDFRKEMKYRVAILDTGIMMNHPAVKSNIFDYYDFTGEGIEDQNGHGTFMAMHYVKMNPNVELVIVKVLDRHKNGFEKDIVEGLRWASERNVFGYNLSFSIERTKKCNESCVVCKELKYIDKNRLGMVFASVPNNPVGHFCPGESNFCFSGGNPKTKKVLNERQKFTAKVNGDFIPMANE